VQACADTAVGIGWQWGKLRAGNLKIKDPMKLEVSMWSRKIIMATLVAAAAVTLTRHVPATTTAIGYAQSPSAFSTALR